jgi:hypothetical protein
VGLVYILAKRPWSRISMLPVSVKTKSLDAEGQTSVAKPSIAGRILKFGVAICALLLLSVLGFFVYHNFDGLVYLDYVPDYPFESVHSGPRTVLKTFAKSPLAGVRLLLSRHPIATAIAMFFVCLLIAAAVIIPVFFLNKNETLSVNWDVFFVGPEKIENETESKQDGSYFIPIIVTVCILVASIASFGIYLKVGNDGLGTLSIKPISNESEVANYRDLAKDIYHQHKLISMIVAKRQKPKNSLLDASFFSDSNSLPKPITIVGFANGSPVVQDTWKHINLKGEKLYQCFYSFMEYLNRLDNKANEETALLLFAKNSFIMNAPHVEPCEEVTKMHGFLAINVMESSLIKEYEIGALPLSELEMLKSYIDNMLKLIQENPLDDEEE